jgi:pyruvate-ferredoxin/flavodoxin oxidoreductase
MGQVCGGVIGYPITPSTEIAEIFEASRADGQLNVWGKHPFFVEAEGEHSAQSGALAAAMTGGNYVSNASSSQGILYAMEGHYVTAGKKIGGFVLQMAARVVTRHSLNVMAGHDDVYALLPTGYTVLFGSDPQEAADLAAIAYRTSALSLIPVANAMDGFATSHVMSEVMLPEPELLKDYLGDPAGRIPCPTVAQEVLFGAKGRVDYLTNWLKARQDQITEEGLEALRVHLNQNPEAVEADNDGILEPLTEVHLPESLRAQWRRAWKGAWQKGTRPRVPAIVDQDNPGLAGGVQNQPDFQAGAADHRTHFASAVPSLVRQAMAEYAELTGRDYAPVKKYGPEDAELVLVGLGSITDDCRALLPYFESQGIKVAVVSVKLLNPFPNQELVAALAGAKQVTILERSEETALATAVKRALFEAGRSAADLTLTTAIFGLGSHDVQPRDLIAVVQNMVDGPKAPLIYVGTQFFVKNPATDTLASLQDRLRAAYPETEAMALPTGPNPAGLLPAEALRIRFHSVGGYGTVATGKLLTDMLAGMLKMHSKSAPKYGSEKSGAATNFYITLSPEPVLFTNASLEEVEVVISPDHKVFHHERPLRGLVNGGTFIMQSAETPLEVWRSLPAAARQELTDKQIRFLVIDAFAVAKTHAPTASLETRMMGIAFIGAMIGHVDRLNLGEPSQIQDQVREELVKKFGSQGDAVVNANLDVIIEAIGATKVVDYTAEEFATSDETGGAKIPVLSGALVPSTGSTPTGMYDPAYFDDMLGRPFREGWAGQAPILPGTGLFIPNGTGAAKNKGLFRREVPVVDLTKCTACLECALACPDSAIPSQAHEISDLLGRAIRVAAVEEIDKAALLGALDALSQAVREKLVADTALKSLPEAVRLAADVVPGLSDGALELVVAELETYPTGRIRSLFDVPEKQESGSGVLYSLVIDPWKCTGCLQCVEVCGPGALSTVVQTESGMATMESTFVRLIDLPNTPKRLTAGAAKPGGDAKRVLLDRNNYFALAGGHGACRGCGEVTATHLVMALAQSLGQEKYASRVTELTDLVEKLTDKAQTVTGDRAARINAALTQLEASLWSYEAGPTGQGPSPTVIVNSTGCSSVYSSTFPSNPFNHPWFNSLFQDAQASAIGIFEGLVSKYVAEVQARRIADLELNDSFIPGVDDKALARLTWRDFTDEEIAGLPLVLTISGDGAAFDIGFGALSRVLTAGAPVKMLVLDTGVYSNTGGQASTASFTGQNSDLARHGSTHPGKKERRKELGLIAALHPRVYAASLSTAYHAHYLAAVSRFITYPEGAGLLQVYTPCGFEQGFADDLSNAQARLAVRSRIAPLFVHDPRAGKTIAERLSLEGNPELDKPWATQNLKYVDADGATKVMSIPYTPADFAYSEIRFAKQFYPLAPDAPNPTPIAEYVELTAEARAGRTAYIVTTDADGALVRIAVKAGIVDLVEDRQQYWQLLRFLAGRETKMQAADAAKALANLREELDSVQDDREQAIDEIARALASLATAKDPASVVMPSFGPASVVGVAAPVVPPQMAELIATPATDRPIWLAEADLPKCTNCATCYQELPAIFEQATIVVDGEALEVSRMKPGALDSLTITPELTALMQRVKDTCDAEIIS